MKVTVIGCSTSWSNKPTSSYCINDKILVDCGDGTFKNYTQAKVNSNNIENIFITHLHTDHTFAILNYIYNLSYYKSVNQPKKLNIYGPIGLKKYLKKIIKVLLWEYKKEKLHKLYSIYEIKDFNKTITVEGLNVSFYKLSHGPLTDIGYKFSNTKTSVGFSGDCIQNNNLETFVKDCDNIFLECCNLKTNSKHLGYDYFSYYVKKFPNKKFLAIHYTDNFEEQAKELDITLAKPAKTYRF